VSELSTTGTTEVKAFQFGQLGDVRAVLDSNGNPWFVGADVCLPLDLRTRDVMSALDEDEKRSDTIAGTIFDLMSESGVYSTIMRSRKPEAKQFKRWITHEVLPSIRKTGAYAQPMTQCEMLLAAAQRMVDIERHQIALAREAEEARKDIETHSVAISNHGARLDSIEQHTGFLTILAWCRQHGVSVDNAEAGRMGKMASAVYRQRTGLTPKQTKNEKFGYVNTYPEELLDHLFS
jgi:prophage antirepressor-like protein